MRQTAEEERTRAGIVARDGSGGGWLFSPEEKRTDRVEEGRREAVMTQSRPPTTERHGDYSVQGEKKKSEVAAGGDGENTDAPTTDFRLSGRAFSSQNVDDGFHELECVFMTRPNVAAHWLLRVGALTPTRRGPQRAAQPSNGGGLDCLGGGAKGGLSEREPATPPHQPHLLYWCPRAAVCRTLPASRIRQQNRKRLPCVSDSSHKYLAVPWFSPFIFDEKKWFV